MPGLPALPGAYAAPLLAFALSLALVLAGRARRAAWAAGAAVGTGALAGWLLQFGGPRPWQAALTASGTPRHLLLIAAVALCAGLLAPKVRTRWLGAAAVVLTGWWVARSPATGAQFWRAWLAVGVLAGLFLRVGDARHLAAAPLALAAGLLAAGGPAPWCDAALVAAAAALPLAVAGSTDALPLALLGTATVAMADLGAGRLPRGRFGAVDLACLLALAAPLAVAPLARRLGRLAPAAPVAVAALAGAMAWAGRLALAHR